jgi:hypothetical protein
MTAERQSGYCPNGAKGFLTGRLAGRLKKLFDVIKEVRAGRLIRERPSWNDKRILVLVCDYHCPVFIGNRSNLRPRVHA